MMDRLRHFAASITDSPIPDRIAAIVGLVVGLVSLNGNNSLWLNIFIAIVFAFLLLYFVLLIMSYGYSVKGLVESPWISYHLTHDYKRKEPCWVVGRITFKATSSTKRVVATHVDTNPPRHEYKMVGY